MSERSIAAPPAVASAGDHPLDAVSPGAPLLSVVTPTYNERPAIERHVRAVLAAIEGLAAEVIVVDDDSPDGAWATVDALMNEDPRVRLVRRIGRRGLSSAALEGALAARGRYVAVIDAIDRHDARLLPAMLTRLRAGGCDIVVASPRAEGGDGPARALTRFASKLLTKGRLRDPMGGFFVLGRETIHAAAPRLQADGFKILFDIVMATPDARVAEEPFEAHGPRAPSGFDVAAFWRSACALAAHATKLPARFLSFGLVGLAGVGANLVYLGALHRGLGLDFAPAQALAIWGAATTNFALNSVLTYADRRPRGLGVLGALLLFYVSCAVAAVANLAIANGLFEFGAPWWAAATAGAIAGGVWNFLASDRLVWRK